MTDVPRAAGIGEAADGLWKQPTDCGRSHFGNHRTTSGNSTVSSIYEGECKDYEFSRRFLEDHWRAGYYDAVHTLRHGEALERPAKETLVTFDLAKGRRRLPKRLAMKQAEVRERAFAMPLTSPAYPPGPYRFVDREYLIITYRTDPATSRALVPEPLEPDGALVKYEFIRMPDSTGFGDYTESGQVIPVSFRGRKGAYAHCMFLNDEPPIAGGRELWGFPKKLANPTLHVEIDALVGTLDYGPVRVATGSMGYKHKAVDLNTVAAALAAPNFLLKIIPHVDGTPRICELVEYYLEDITLKGAWTGPAALALHPHALAPVAELPVLEVVSGLHIVADLTLGLGRVAFDYLQ